MPPTPKTVLITGCSAGGIGAAVALTFLKRGHYVFATARSVSKTPTEISEHPNAAVIQLDVSSPSSVAEAVKLVVASGRKLDILFNNAGVAYAMPVLDMDIEHAKEVHNVNIWGVVRTIQAFAGLLIESKGRIVNVSTVGAAVNTPWIAAYSSSKAALVNISETLRLELSPYNVDVVTIMTGTVDSHFHDIDVKFKFKLPEGSRYAPIEEIISAWANGKSVPKGCSAEEFAGKLVDDHAIVGDFKHGGNGKLIWRGPYSFFIRALARCLPRWCLDLAMTFNQGLKELGGHVRDGEGKGKGGGSN